MDNEQFTMEMHLVHYNAEHADGAAALASGDRDALAGVLGCSILTRPLLRAHSPQEDGRSPKNRLVGAGYT